MRPNVFDSDRAAADYAKSRPDVHSAVVRRIGERIALRGMLDLAVDVGCGTGMSTRCLRGIARRAVGIDPSRAMLAAARRAGGGESYILGAAEALPIRGDCADLVTVSQAYHWCHERDLLDEAARVLVPDGWLVVYDSFFSPREGPLAELLAWINSDLWRGHPVPDRGDLPDPDRISHPALQLMLVENLVQTIPMDGAQFSAFLLTQSRSLAAIDWAGARYEELERALRERIVALVGTDAVPIPFSGPIFFVRRGR